MERVVEESEQDSASAAKNLEEYLLPDHYEGEGEDYQDGSKFLPEDGNVDFFNEGEQLPEHEASYTEKPEAEATQLAHRYPQIDTPLRVDPPSSMKAPHRVEPPTREQQIRDQAFSPQAFTLRVQVLTPLLSEDIQTRLREEKNKKQVVWGADDQRPQMNGMASGEDGGKGSQKDKQWGQMDATYRTAIRDLQMLAYSSKRAGKTETEGHAYYALGVLLDNLGHFHKAIEAYNSFLGVCRASQEVVQEALAHNCIGVDSMLLAMKAMNDGRDCSQEEWDTGASIDDPIVATDTNIMDPLNLQPDKEAPIPDTAQDLLNKALECHNNHLLITDDGGKCVAHTNMGLCYGLLNKFPVAATHHQEALRMALKIQSLGAQSIAVGNLGLLAMRQGDNNTARSCMEQHLQLVQSLKDTSSEIHAWSQLGYLANKERNYEEGSRCFEQAARLADQQGDFSTLKRLNCNIGIARGNLKMMEYLQNRVEVASHMYL